MKFLVFLILSAGLLVSSSSSARSLDASLGATPLIDKDHPRIQSTAAKLTRGLETDSEKAVAIHDFVRDKIAYGFGPKFYEHRASEVLRMRRGFCNSKSTLFIALLRSAEIPARLRFVELAPPILDGIVKQRTPWIDHSYCEVWLHGKWVGVDSYNVDARLFKAAQAKLKREGKDLGYGVHKNGKLHWDGIHPNFSQYVNGSDRPKISKRELGVHRDVETFYATTEGAWNEMDRPTRVFFPIAAFSMNHKLANVRASSPKKTVKWRSSLSFGLRKR